MARRGLWCLIAWGLSVGGGLTGCHAAKPIVASTADYGDYRRVRTAATLDERLARANHYLEARPDGWYAPRLRRYFERAEPLYYKVRRQNAPGLTAYLAALPHGPHAEDALRRLSALRLEKNRGEVAAEVLADASTRIRAQKARRREAARALIGWAIDMLDPELWDGRDLAAAPGAFQVRYELALPAPVCGPSEEAHQLCFKTLELPYRLTGAGRQGPRSVAFAMEALLDRRRRPEVLRLRGYRAFVRAEEAAQNVAVNDPASARRAFVDRLGRALLTAGRICNGSFDAQGRGQLDCEGASLTVAPGQSGSDVGADEDLIEVRRRQAPTEEASP